MKMMVLINEVPEWSDLADTVRSKTIDLSPDARFVTLEGESTDKDCRCDDLVWGSVRFER